MSLENEGFYRNFTVLSLHAYLNRCHVCCAAGKQSALVSTDWKAPDAASCVLSMYLVPGLDH